MRDEPLVYHRYKRLKSKLGTPFARCIKTGMDHPGRRQILQMGVVAGDADCYATFEDLFNPVIEARHFGWTPERRHERDLSPDKVLDRPLFRGDSSSSKRGYVSRVKVRSARSIEGYRFPPACTKDERRAVEKLAVEALGTLTGELAGSYCPLSGSVSHRGLSGADEEQAAAAAAHERKLQAAGLVFPQPTSPQLISSGMNRDWPDARGVFSDSRGQGSLLVWVNEEDHLRIMALERGCDIRAAFARFVSAVDGVEAALRKKGHGYSWTDHLGYLLTCPSNVGTGLRVSVQTALPGVSSMEGFKAACHALGLQPKPAGGRGAGLFDLSNMERLGSTEVELVNT
eukprot:COSAG01_NODE_14100_length_1495_cov_111.743553_2_plen_342_part_01